MSQGRLRRAAVCFAQQTARLGPADRAEYVTALVLMGRWQDALGVADAAADVQQGARLRAGILLDAAVRAPPTDPCRRLWRELPPPGTRLGWLPGLFHLVAGDHDAAVAAFLGADGDAAWWDRCSMALVCLLAGLEQQAPDCEARFCRYMALFGAPDAPALHPGRVKADRLLVLRWAQDRPWAQRTDRAGVLADIDRGLQAGVRMLDTECAVLELSRTHAPPAALAQAIGADVGGCLVKIRLIQPAHLRLALRG